jgi:hypothetical protein
MGGARTEPTHSGSELRTEKRATNLLTGGLCRREERRSPSVCPDDELSVSFWISAVIRAAAAHNAHWVV